MDSTRRRFLLRTAALSGAAFGRPSRTFPAAVPAMTSPNAGHAADPHAAAAQSAAGAATLNPGEETLAHGRNWGRWGPDDAMGAVNLITPEKRTAAAALVKSGRTVSLSRPFEPAQHFIQLNQRGTGGSAVDYYGFLYHGVSVTHVDALCHVWDRHGMWNGRDPAKEIDTRGARFADITAFSGGLITRGVLLDVPRHRREPYVAVGRPVMGSELADIARAQGVEVRPGDALLIYSGRDAYVAAGHTYGGATDGRPGLDVSCATFIRDRDVAVLGWDMHDAMPNANGLPWPAHGVIFSYGVALVDNAWLEPLATACAEERRYEFMFLALPLKIPRGTGSPANPIALF